MRQTLLTIAALLLTGIAATAQTLNVTVGNVTYQFPANQTGEMNFTGGSTLTVMGKTFTLSDITSMTTDETAVTDNLVSIVYDGTTAKVSVAGNVAQYVEATVSGAHVTIAQSNTDAVDGDEITYVLSGSTTDGSLTMNGSYKCTVSLAGVTLTNPGGAAINITNSKRIQLSAKKNTVNTLTDAAGGSQKACIYSKGQLQLQGNGTLNVAGYTKHAIKSGDYITVKNLTLNITAAAGDGINCEEYFQMKSGTVTISGVSDDGIQCDLGGTASTGETTDHEDEDSGNIYLEGGTLNVTVTATAAKAVKSEGDMRVSGGDITCKTTGGGSWDTDDMKTKAAACMSADGNMTISGGTLTLTSTGAGGKGISVDGTLTVTDGTVNVNTSGNAVVASSSGTISTVSNSQQLDRYTSDYKSLPKGIKADGDININGGTLNVVTKGAGGEGIESKSTLTMTDGYVYASTADDGINCSSTMTISGGYIMVSSSGNDGLDANGNMNITGGNIFSVCAGGAEVGLDAAEQYKLNITGGNIVAIGGFEKGANVSGGTAKQAASYTKGAWYALYNGSDTAFAFKVPSNSSMGDKLVVYTTGTPSLKTGVTGSGTSFWNGNGYSSATGGSTVSLSDYNSNSGSGPGGGPGGGGGWGH
ncbi:MAG: carbohydrate-binding domain-containing protein [Prevotella sp.]|nr:carbohydrate-binding domain-containing protein [Prevotella sp.]